MSETTLANRTHPSRPPNTRPEQADHADRGSADAQQWETTDTTDTDTTHPVAELVGVQASWSHMPADEAYDTPIPFTAPAWLQVSRADEYADYDAAIPFHVVDAYTRHMSDDGDSLDR